MSRCNHCDTSEHDGRSCPTKGTSRTKLLRAISDRCSYEQLAKLVALLDDGKPIAVPPRPVQKGIRVPVPPGWQARFEKALADGFMPGEFTTWQVLPISAVDRTDDTYRTALHCRPHPKA